MPACCEAIICCAAMNCCANTNCCAMANCCGVNAGCTGMTGSIFGCGELVCRYVDGEFEGNACGGSEGARCDDAEVGGMAGFVIIEGGMPCSRISSRSSPNVAPPML